MSSIGSHSRYLFSLDDTVLGVCEVIWKWALGGGSRSLGVAFEVYTRPLLPCYPLPPEHIVSRLCPMNSVRHELNCLAMTSLMSWITVMFQNTLLI